MHYFNKTAHLPFYWLWVFPCQYDRETETMWYPYSKGLMGIQGEYFKRWLPKMQSDDMRWEKWKRKHPDSKVLN